MLRGGWHGEHRRHDARSPTPARIGAAKAAPPVQSRILGRGNPKSLNSGGFIRDWGVTEVTPQTFVLPTFSHDSGES